MEESLKDRTRDLLKFLAKSCKRIPVAEAIFTIACANPRIAKRVAALYRKKKANRIIVSGKGLKETIPYGFWSEAEYCASVLVAAGVPREALILNEVGHRASELVILGMAASGREEFFPQKLIVCALPYLLPRYLATFKEWFPNIETFGTTFGFRKHECTEKEMRRILDELDWWEIDECPAFASDPHLQKKACDAYRDLQFAFRKREEQDKDNEKWPVL